MESVRNEVRRNNVDCFVFSRYDRRCHIEIDIRSEVPTLNFHILGQTIRGTEIGSVWWRLKPFGLFYPENPTRNAVQEFVGREWHHLLNSTPAFLQNAKWINSIEVQTRANLKPQQLIWARQAGFDIPKTIFSNSYEKLRDFSEHQDLVYKTLSGYIFPEASAIFTSRIENEHISSTDPARIGVAPGIYQEYINKRFEIRVFFIGDEVYCIKIDSQSHPDTIVDWRENQSLSINELIDLEDDWQTKIMEFQRLSGLRYGAIDAIITKSNQIVFLECNPAGQWLWLEEQTGVPISAAVARALVKSLR